MKEMLHKSRGIGRLKDYVESAASKAELEGLGAVYATPFADNIRVYVHPSVPGTLFYFEQDKTGKLSHYRTLPVPQMF